MKDTPAIRDARAAVVNTVRMYAPVHKALSEQARTALDKALDDLQAAVLQTPPVEPIAMTPPAGKPAAFDDNPRSLPEE